MHNTMQRKVSFYKVGYLWPLLSSSSPGSSSSTSNLWGVKRQVNKDYASIICDFPCKSYPIYNYRNRVVWSGVIQFPQRTFEGFLKRSTVQFPENTRFNIIFIYYEF